MPAEHPLRAPKAKVADRGFRWLTLLTGLLVLVILLAIAVSTTKQAWPAFRHEGLGFVTSKVWSPSTNRFGALAFIYGTMVSAAIALVLAVPTSVGIALFLTELAPHWLKRPVTFVIDLLAAVPSVVFGLWGILVLAPNITAFYDKVGRVLGWTTIFAGPGQGKSFFTAGIILALMVTPIVTSITREVFDTTPPGQKEAALALGATRWEMIRGAVLPHSKAGVVGAVMLGLGRAMGETIAAALVIGSNAQISGRLFGPGDTMAAVIANQFGESEGTFRAGLIGLGVVLFAITIVVNLAARAVVGDRAAARQGLVA